MQPQEELHEVPGDPGNGCTVKASFYNKQKSVYTKGKISVECK